ncbi:MAG TPA: hypothetical protein VK009_21070 [Chloroflexota bacterium]|nr:hypothetical protein [Chloroflexota bacterium]
MYSAMKPFSSAPARLAAGLAMVLAIVCLPSLASAQVLTSQNATASVTITDTGISPASVTIPQGGSVTWTNKGNRTHTADSTGGPSTFNTAGIGPGSSATLVFTVPGLYAYTAGTDCLHGVYIETFTCGDYTIAVLANGALPQAATTPTPTPIAPAQAGPLPAATVTISDATFAPATTEIALDANVTFTNNGTRVHSATLTPDSVSSGLPFFDTGGLGPGQSKTVGFTVPGTYVYYSTPDCFDKSNAPGFNCGYYTIVVDSSPAVSPTGQAAPTPTPVPVAGASASVTIDDVNGFTPNTVTIHVGQTVGWYNAGTVTHSVVINQNFILGAPAPWWLPYQLPSVGGVSFNSGGLAPKQTFNYTFTVAGTFPYHSSTEPIYLVNNPNCSCTFTTYKFFGTVVVLP